jgi:hypothetical protein
LSLGQVAKLDDRDPSPLARTMNLVYIRNEDGFVCPEPGCGFSVTKEHQNTMHYHMKKHAGAMSHVCKEPGCGAAFIQKSGLDQHRVQKHTETVAWACPCCDHACKMKANLLIHIGRKHGAGWIPPLTKTGICSGIDCGKMFVSPTAYYYHAVQCFAAPVEMSDKLALLTATEKTVATKV